ncbi:MAG: glycosyltransferase family 4 protein [Hyphomicrobiaceae bacterium]
MKVLYFHQHFSTPRGAAGTRSYEMARRLVARGHKVTIVCGRYDGGDTGLAGPFANGRRQGNVDGIDVIEFDLAYSNTTGFTKRSSIFIRYALRCVGLVLSEPADLIFATTTPLTAGIPGIFARLLTSKPFVFEVRDLWPELPRALGVIRNPLVFYAMGALEWASYRAAHRLVALAPGIVKGIEQRGVDASRIAMIPNGCDLDVFDALNTTWLPEGVGPDDLLAVFAGTHGIANGLDAVLDCAALLKARQRSDIKLILIGQGKLKPALQARAAHERLDNVIFAAPVAKQKIAGLMAVTDVGLQILANVEAFYYGTSPNKFFDYIAAGRPVLTNYPGWVADMIGDHACGFAVPPGDAGAFADALEYAADNRAALVGMSERSRALARARFSRNMLADQFADWLEAAHAQPL